MKPSAITLVIANVIPVIGVLFLDWDLFQVILIYWAESGVIGFYNIFKLIQVSGILGLFIVPFFILHFGGFMFGHLVFITLLFGRHLLSDEFLPTAGTFVSLINVIWIPILVLFVSHGFSFFINYMGQKESGTDLINRMQMMNRQMASPYSRIVVMHITIILSGLLVLVLNAPILGLVLLIVLKTFVDLRSHIKEHSFSRI